MRRGPRRLTLRFTITFSLGFILAIAAGAILALNYLSAKETLVSFSKVVLDPVASLINEKTRGFLEPVGRAAKIGYALPATGLVDPDAIESVEKAYFALMRANPQFFSLDFGDRAGNHAGDHQRGHVAAGIGPGSVQKARCDRRDGQDSAHQHLRSVG